MELIFIRHGQAEKRQPEKNDAERALTPRGEAKIRKIAQALKDYLPVNKRMVIWSSPMIRSLQTAAILAEAWRQKVDRINDSIGTGDLESLAAEWCGLDRDEICLVVVGHEPYLSDWSREICGIELPFKKGSAAGFRLSVPGIPDGKLLWFIQAEILENKSEDGKNGRTAYCSLRDELRIMHQLSGDENGYQSAWLQKNVLPRLSAAGPALYLSQKTL